MACPNSKGLEWKSKRDCLNCCHGSINTDKLVTLRLVCRSDMATIFQFLSDLTLIKIKHDRRSQIISGAIQPPGYVPSIIRSGSYRILFEVWIYFLQQMNKKNEPLWRYHHSSWLEYLPIYDETILAWFLSHWNLQTSLCSINSEYNYNHFRNIYFRGISYEKVIKDIYTQSRYMKNLMIMIEIKFFPNSQMYCKLEYKRSGSSSKRVGWGLKLRHVNTIGDEQRVTNL